MLAAYFRPLDRFRNQRRRSECCLSSSSPRAAWPARQRQKRHFAVDEIPDHVGDPGGIAIRVAHDDLGVSQRGVGGLYAIDECIEGRSRQRLARRQDVSDFRRLACFRAIEKHVGCVRFWSLAGPRDFRDLTALGGPSDIDHVLWPSELPTAGVDPRPRVDVNALFAGPLDGHTPVLSFDHPGTPDLQKRNKTNMFQRFSRYDMCVVGVGNRSSRVMARRPSAPAAPRAALLTLDQMQQGVVRLRKRIADVEAFDPTSIDPANPTASVQGLQASIQEALMRTFGADSVEYKLYTPATAWTWPTSFYQVSPADIVANLGKTRQRSIDLLTQAMRMLEERIDEAGIPVPAASPVAASLVDFDSSNHKVFVVHGRDTAARESVARFLERAGFSAIILSEQTNRDGTLIEKFENHSDVRFAVVLLTADDVGGLPGLAVGMLNGRARQNVILELGYFIGKLGRERVCVLKSDDVEIPSDVHGVGYTDLDAAGVWQLKLAKELQDAGYVVDLNKALQL